MLKKLKQLTLSSLKSVGVFGLVRNSRWRRARLLILAYHGISLDDEHQWNPMLFMTPDNFKSRMQILRQSGCNVLPLHEALQRLHANELPEKTVALTFDDGLYDFYVRAYPILREFNFPATLYLTTFYSHYNRPVFDVACSYLLWKSRDRAVDFKDLTGQDHILNLASADDRAAALDELQRFVRQRKLSAEEKDAFASTIAQKLRVDYQALCAKRLLHLLTPDEVKQLASAGVDIQLHTHRHRTPRDRSLFCREITDNRDNIQALTGLKAAHFCYPSGVYHSDFLPWLSELGVESATTCEPGLASSSSNSLLLPRLVDTSLISPIEFEGWLSGISTFLPNRKHLTDHLAKRS